MSTIFIYFLIRYVFMDFKDRLKSLRLSNNLTQLDIANYLKINDRSYQNLEYGKSKPKYDTLIKLADYYNISIDYLVGRSDDPTRR